MALGQVLDEIGTLRQIDDLYLESPLLWDGMGGEGRAFAEQRRPTSSVALGRHGGEGARATRFVYGSGQA